jgi:hypothetical protein
MAAGRSARSSSIAAAIFSGISVPFAGLFGFILTDGQPLALQAVTGGLLVALDLVKLGILAMLRRRYVGWGTWLLAACSVAILSVLSLTGIYCCYDHFVGAQTAAAAQERAVRESLIARQTKLQEQFDALGQVPPEARAEADLRQHRWDTKFARSGACNGTPASGVLDYCRKEAQLVGAVEVAKQAQGLRDGIGALDGEIAKATTARAVETGKRGLQALAAVVAGDVNAESMEQAKGVALAIAVELVSLVLLPLVTAPMRHKPSGQTPAQASGGTLQHPAVATPPSSPADGPSEAPAASSGSPLSPASGSPPSNRREPSVKPSVKAANNGSRRAPNLRLVKPSGNAEQSPVVAVHKAVAAFVATLQTEPGRTFRLAELREAYIAFAEVSGLPVQVADNPLGPALIAAGFAKYKDRRGCMAYVDQRQPAVPLAEPA